MNASRKQLFFQWAVIITGAAAGVLGPLLQYFGNPKNMGFCIACMERDIVGALGLHRAAVVQFMRPEIPGIVLGALLAALVFREFRGRTGSAPIIRFTLGISTMIGALVFLGCPWRGLLRLSGGDWTAIAGLAGLAVGIRIGIQFLRSGYDLGRSYKSLGLTGWVLPLLAAGMAALSFAPVRFSEGGAIFASTEGAGAAHAPVIISLIAGLIIGFLAQRSRFCTIGSFRDLFLMRDMYLMRGVIAFVVVAAVSNVILGQFKPGMSGQTIAHTMHLWNFGGLLLVGLASTLGGGCPARQLVLSGEGDADAGIYVLGMFAGAGLAHNMAMASTPAGVAAFGPVAVIFGLVICLAIGFVMKERTAK